MTGIVLSDFAHQTVFLEALDLLQTSGGAEDGYAALEYAIVNTQPRPDTVRLMVLVTDEDRRVIREDLDRDTIENIIRESGYVIVNHGFLADPSDEGLHAVGLDKNQTAHVFKTLPAQRGVECGIVS